MGFPIAMEHSAINVGRASLPMSHLVVPSSSSGKGLAGFDGAAQAGMIRAEVERPGRLEKAFIIAYFASHYLPCYCGRPCCSGKRSNSEWLQAMGVLSSHLKEVVLLGSKTTIDQRMDYLKLHITSGRKESRSNGTGNTTSRR